MTSIANMKKPLRFQEDLGYAFPDVNPGVKPFGSGIVIQLKNGAEKTEGGILVGAGATQTDNDTTQVGKVIALGPVCFCNRETGKQWIEGAWCKEGDFVRIPLHLGSARSWRIAVPGKDYFAVFTIIDDLQLAGLQADPFYIRSYL